MKQYKDKKEEANAMNCFAGTEDILLSTFTISLFAFGENAR